MNAIRYQMVSWKELGWKGVLRKTSTWIVFAGFLVVFSAATIGYKVYADSQAQEVTTPEIQTATARLGELTVFATGVGEVIAAKEIDVGFDESGTLTELFVSLGEEVQAGQVLARLETDQSEVDIALALAEAELEVLTAQQELDQITENAELDAAMALKAYEEAQEALEDLQNIELQQAQAKQAIAEAEEALRTAQSVYNGVRSTAGQSTIDAAHAELVLAEQKLKDQQEKFKEYAHKPDTDLEKANAQLKLSAAQATYDSALRYYNAVTGTGSDVDLALSAADLAAAEANLSEAQKTYDRIKDGPPVSELAITEAELALAKTEYEKLQTGPDPVEIALAEAKLANAQAKLAVAQEDQAVLELVAPIDGTIMEINASLGEELSVGAFITLADLSQPILTIYLDETDLDKIGLGFEAEVIFDSLPDSTFTGSVIEINPSLQTSFNVDTLVAKVQLNEDSYSKPISLPVGSNASVDVIGGRVENAVLVPVEALREIGTDEYTVFVMEDGELKLRVVTVGLMDYTSAEITSGLEAGEVVTTGVVETNQ